MAVPSVTLNTGFSPTWGGAALPAPATLRTVSARHDAVTFGCRTCENGDDEKKAKTNFKPQTVQLWDKNLSTLQNIALFPIYLYQRLTRGKSGHTVLGKVVSARCPYNPSCSEYGAEAIRKHGAVKGWLLALYRTMIKCNPIYFIYRHFRYGDSLTPGPRSIEDPVK